MIHAVEERKSAGYGARWNIRCVWSWEPWAYVGQGKGASSALASHRPGSLVRLALAIQCWVWVAGVPRGVRRYR